MEPISAALMTFGGAILLISWVMLLITAFREDFTWGLCTLFLPPVAYLYGFARWSKANEALLFGLLGLVLIILA